MNPLVEIDVSVVIPVFRGRDTIARAVASVDRQMVRPREILVVDNEPDSQLAPLLPVTSVPLQIVPEPRRGAAFARNTALKLATGRYAAFLDCDDYWNDGFLSAMKAATCRHRDAQLFAGSALVVDGSSTRTVRPEDLSNHGLEKLLLHNSITTSGTLVCAEAARSAGGFHEGLRLGAGCEDWALWIAMLRHGRGIAVLDATVTRLESPSSLRMMGADSLYADMEDVLRRALPRDETRLWTIARSGMAMHRGTHFLRAGRVGDARREFALAARLHPNQPHVWGWLALSLMPSAVRRSVSTARRRLLRLG